MTTSRHQVPSTVFHYTSSEGLLGILETRTLWLADIEFMNDAQEMRYGVDLVRAAAVEFKDLVEYERAMDPGSWARISSLVIDIDARFPPIGGFRTNWERRPYVACFCGEGDLLSMWRGYTGGNGFAIEFDVAVVLDALRAEVPGIWDLTEYEYAELRRANFGLSASFESIEYGPESVMELIALLVHDTPGSLELAEPWSGAKLIDRAMLNLARVKHPAFAEEKEVRLVAFGTGDLSPQPRLRSANGHLAPYFPVSFPHEAIRSIRVGPAPQRERSKIALERRLGASAREEFGHVELTVSDAPLLY